MIFPGGKMKPRAHGFTLLEVMVAVSILAIAAVGLTSAISGYINSTSERRDSMMAHWVAQNQMAETSLKLTWPKQGKTRGEVTLADRQWFWQQEVKETSDEDLRRVEITVSLDDKGDHSVAQLVGFIGRKNVPRS